MYTLGTFIEIFTLFGKKLWSTKSLWLEKNVLGWCRAHVCCRVFRRDSLLSCRGRAAPIIFQKFGECSLMEFLIASDIFSSIYKELVAVRELMQKLLQNLLKFTHLNQGFFLCLKGSHFSIPGRACCLNHDLPMHRT